MSLHISSSSRKWTAFKVKVAWGESTGETVVWLYVMLTAIWVGAVCPFVQVFLVMV